MGRRCSLRVLDYRFCNNSGSLAMLTAIRRASSFVSRANTALDWYMLSCLCGRPGCVKDDGSAQA